MASASSTSARLLFADSKVRLAERVQLNVNSVSSLLKHLVKSSKSTEVLMQSARTLANQENTIITTEQNLQRLNLLCVHLGQQQDSMLASAHVLDDIQEQVQHNFSIV